VVIHPKILVIALVSVLTRVSWNGSERSLNLTTTGSQEAIFVKLLLCIVLLASVAGCYTSQHRPVMFRAESDVQCPDWSVPVEVDGRYYCIDRSFFDDEDD